LVINVFETSVSISLLIAGHKLKDYSLSELVSAVGADRLPKGVETEVRQCCLAILCWLPSRTLTWCICLVQNAAEELWRRRVEP